MTREYTNKILNYVDQGLFNERQLILDLLLWMSEDDVKEYYLRNGYDEAEEYDND